MQTETLDKLFLELSQFTQAKTGNELLALRALKKAKPLLPHPLDEGLSEDQIRAIDAVENAIQCLES